MSDCNEIFCAVDFLLVLETRFLLYQIRNYSYHLNDISARLYNILKCLSDEVAILWDQID